MSRPWRMANHILCNFYLLKENNRAMVCPCYTRAIRYGYYNKRFIKKDKLNDIYNIHNYTYVINYDSV